MPIITEQEHDNMKVEAELRIRRLFEEYKIRAQGDRLEGVRKNGERQIQDSGPNSQRYGSREQALGGNTPVVRSASGRG
jgi:hypothetical protein